MSKLLQSLEFSMYNIKMLSIIKSKASQLNVLCGCKKNCISHQNLFLKEKYEIHAYSLFYLTPHRLECCRTKGHFVCLFFES